MNPLSKHIVLLLVLLIVFHSVFPGLFGLAFNRYRSFFTKYYCVNKDKPEIDCQARCFFGKIKNQFDSSSISKSGFEIEWPFQYCQLFHIVIRLILEERTISGIELIRNYYFSIQKSTFHPPEK